MFSLENISYFLFDIIAIGSIYMQGNFFTWLQNDLLVCEVGMSITQLG